MKTHSTDRPIELVWSDGAPAALIVELRACVESQRASFCDIASKKDDGGEGAAAPRGNDGVALQAMIRSAVTR